MIVEETYTSILTKDTPSHWDTFRIGSIFVERKEKVSDKDFAPLSVTMKGIVPQLDTIAKTNDGDNRKKVCKNDFVINSRSDRKGSGGVSNYMGSVSLINTVLTPNKRYYSPYTNYLFTNNLFQEEFYKFGKGIVDDMWSTKYFDMKYIKVPCPPYQEQTAIANYLDKKCKEIKTFITKKQTFIKLLKEQRQSVIDVMVSGKLLIINGKTQKPTKTKNSGIDWLGDIPEHWEVRRLSSFGKFSKGGNVSKGNLITDQSGEHVLLYGEIYTKYEFEVEKLVNRITKETADKSTEIMKGDLLFTGSGEDKAEIGKCIVYTGDEVAYAGGDVIIFRQNEFDSRFISYSQNTNMVEYQKYISSKGDIIVHTSASKLKNVVMPFPPNKKEQSQIITHIKTETSKIDQAISKSEKEIELIQEYQKAMIAEAVLGKI